MAKKNSEELKEWKNFRRELYEIKQKSDDDFEKYITLISSGGLALTVTFINDLIPLNQSNHTYLIIVGWTALALTLFVSLFSHYKSSINLEKNINEIDSDLEYNKLNENIDHRNKNIDFLNKLSMVLLGSGIVLILFFISLNLKNVENTTKTTETSTSKATTKTFNTERQGKN